MISFTAAELLLLRPAAPAINRHTRKTLFALHLWLPTHFRYRAEPVVYIGQHRPTAGTKRVDRRSITAACFNAHSVRNKAASLQDIIVNHDVIAITETWHL